MRAVGLFMRATSKRRFLREDGAQELLTRAKGDAAPPRRVREALDVTTEPVRGHDVHVLRRAGTPAGVRPVVVYVHGGAYVNELVRQHWDFVAELAAEVDVEVWLPVYGLAPQHDAAQARALLAELLDRLRREGRPCWLAGDSAGAALALVAAQQQADEGSTVRGLTLMAPWLDLSMVNPDLDAAERADPWLARAALREVARTWAAGTPLDDGAVSPLFGRFAGLPPTHVLVGTRDLTHPDCRLLVQRLREAGVETTYDELPGAIHVYPLLPVPEGRRAAAAIRRRIAAGLGVAPPREDDAVLWLRHARTFALPVDAAYDRVLAAPLERVFDRRHLLIAPITRTEGQQGEWGRVGQTRTIVLGDGSTMREELVDIAPGQRFDYHLDRVTGLLRPLLREVDGRWTFAPDGDGTRVTWSWRVTLVGPQAPVVAPVLARLWQGFAGRGFDRLEGLLREGHRGGR